MRSPFEPDGRDLSFGLVVGLATMIAVIAAQPASPAFADTDLDETQAVEILEYKYSPILYVQRIDDSCVTGSADFGPLPVESILGNSTARLEGPGGTVFGPTAPDVFLKGERYYLDLPGQPTSPGCRYERDFASLQRGVQPVVYARIGGERGLNGLVLQYWIFYYFDDWNNKHEGDWEMIQLSFRANSAQSAVNMNPDTLSYTQHRSGETAHWDSGKLQREGTHPVVYVARGSHANYYRPHTFLGLGENGSGLGCDVASGDRIRVVPRVVPLPSEPIPATSPFAWVVYFGLWGQAAPGEFGGPTGPHTTIRWYQPLTWQDSLRESSAIVPAAGALGSDSLRSFCAAITFVGKGLATYETWPELAVFVVATSVVCVALVGFAVVRETRRFGAMSVSRGSGLRRARSILQILASAAVLYLQRLPVFLGIGALTIPAGVLAFAVSHFMLSKPPLDSIASLYERNLPIRALISLQYGLLQLRLVYPLIVAAVSVEITQSDKDRPLSPLLAYKRSLIVLPHVFLARSRALLLQFALCLTLVGIPVASYWSIRWTFVEHAVLFEDVHGMRALDFSAGLVKGNVFRVGVTSLILGGVLTLSVPLLAALFLFASPLSLAAINVVAGLLFAALLPYLALCLTLFYFDLVRRHDADAN